VSRARHARPRGPLFECARIYNRARFRAVLRSAAALEVRGKLEHSSDGVLNVVAHHVSPLRVAVGARSRDFR